MGEINPCETCKRKCPFKLFIDCPIWLEWAEEQNALANAERDTY